LSSDWRTRWCEGVTPPTSALGIDLIVHRVTMAFRPANEPGYVVLIYPDACAAPSGLPWARLPIG